MIISVTCLRIESWTLRENIMMRCDNWVQWCCSRIWSITEYLIFQYFVALGSNGVCDLALCRLAAMQQDVQGQDKQCICKCS